ncbi:MAG: class I SAM-dependent methyltransferase [Planctomycetota bacterium]
MDPTKRFSDRVADYVRYRPDYPPAVLDRLAERFSASPDVVDVVDVGAGTGIWTRQMADRGWAVTAVEPNDAMRKACEAAAEETPGIRVINAGAESTGLPDGCADLVTAAQAFHWFDPDAALREFRRLLRPGGFVALLWNSRQTDTTVFLRDYERMLQDFATDYGQVNHQRFEDGRLSQMIPDGYALWECPHVQSFDFAGLCGRLLSSSYAPPAGHPNHHAMLDRLREVFETHEENGRVEFRYTTQLYTGRPI